MKQRDPLDRVYSYCIGFCVAASLLYLGVQLLLSVWLYLVMVTLLGAVIAVANRLIRWHRERW